MSTLVDRVVPTRWGADVWRLVAATWLVQLVDGLALVAGPLAVASLTHAPFLVALAVALHRVPVLLLGPYAAFLADLVNRRLLVVAADAARAGVLLVLAALLALGAAPVALLLAAMLVLGLLETVADSARAPVLPMLVDEATARDAVGARLDAGFVGGTQLAGPVLGALLFAVGPAAPFLAQALLLGVAVLVFSRLPLRGPSRGPAPAAVRHPVRSGLRRIAVDPALSGLLLVGLAAQAAWAAGWSLLVLYTAGQLGLGEVGFGLLVVAGAAGGMTGVGLRPLVDQVARALRALTPVRLLLGGLALEVLGHLALGQLHTPWLAATTLALLGAVGFVTGDLARDQRRARTTADGSADVVASASATLGLAATVVGCLVGGLLATVGGIAAAYTGGGLLLGLALILLFRRVLAL